MIAPWGAWRGVKAGFVGNPGAHGFCHFVVDFQDDSFGAGFSVFPFVLPFNDWEGFHDVNDGIAGVGNWCLSRVKSSDFSSQTAPAWPFAIRDTPRITAGR